MSPEPQWSPSAERVASARLTRFCDAEIVLFDSNPAGEVLRDLAADAGVTTFGTSAAYVSARMEARAVPRKDRDLSALRAVGCTGSPLSPEGFT